MNDSVITLQSLPIGQMAKVKKVNGEGPVRRRLMDMGITKGVAITAVKRSPLGDPIEFRLRGYSLSLRGSEAALIEVEL